MVPEFYLNVLINVCGTVNEETLANERFRNVIPEFMTVVYYHAFSTFSSCLLINKDNASKELKKNVVSLHWVTEMFPHQQLIKS